MAKQPQTTWLMGGVMGLAEGSSGVQGSPGGHTAGHRHGVCYGEGLVLHALRLWAMSSSGCHPTPTQLS